MSRGSLFVSLALITVAPAFASARGSSSTFPVQQSAAEQQQRPVFEATTERVRVDVIVTDEEGNFVEDLTADDFILLEDGERQPVLSLQLVDLQRGRIVELAGDGGGGREADALAPPSPAGGGLGAASEPEAGELAADEYGGIFVLVDSPGLDWRMRARFAAYWQSWLDDADTPTVPWAVYLLDDDASLHELAPLTRDLADLRETPDRLREPQKLRDAVFGSQPRDLRGGMPSGGATPTRSRLVDPLTSFAEGLARQRRGRIALVWVTSLRGIVTSALARAANSANVSIYVLDPGTGVMASNPRRLQRTMSHPIADASLRRLPGGGMGPAFHEWLSGRFAAQFLLRGRIRDQRRRLSAAPAATGGEFFADWFGLDGPLAAIEADTSRYYLLTYEPPPPPGDGRYHEIRVEVRRPGVHVRARGGYLDRAPASSELTEAFRYFGAAGDHLPLVFDTLLTWTEEGKARLIVASGLDGSAVESAPGSVPEEIELSGQVLDGRGQMVMRLWHRFREADSRAAAGDLLRRAYVWEGKPGVYQLHVLARGPANERVSTLFRRIEILDPESAGWQASDPLLLVPGTEGELVPIPGGQTREGERIVLLQQVLGGQRPVLSGTLRRTTGIGVPRTDLPDVVGDPSAELPADVVAVVSDVDLDPPRDRRGGGVARHQGGFQLPENLEPGDYELELELVDEPAGERRTFLLPLRILPGR